MIGKTKLGSCENQKSRLQTSTKHWKYCNDLYLRHLIHETHQYLEIHDFLLPLQKTSIIIAPINNIDVNLMSAFCTKYFKNLLQFEKLLIKIPVVRMFYINKIFNFVLAQCIVLDYITKPAISYVIYLNISWYIKSMFFSSYIHKNDISWYI